MEQSVNIETGGNISALDILGRINLPPQDLGSLSFCQNKAAKVKAWGESLPVTQNNHTAGQLYKALPELVRLKTDPSERLAMLEALRPYVQQCIQGLAKDFLNQPVILPSKAEKTATLAQALQKHLTSAYMVCLRQRVAAYKEKSREHQKQASVSLHRALVGFSLLSLRSYQLYAASPHHPYLWKDLHNLFLAGEKLELLDTPVGDPLNNFMESTTAYEAYSRSLLLACAKPNQLQQNELLKLFSALELWAGFAQFSSQAEQKRENLYIVNLSSNTSPVYKSRFKGGSHDDFREFDIDTLITALNKQKSQGDDGEAIIEIPKSFDSGLFQHVLSAWSDLQQRSFERRRVKTDIDIAIGLTSVHYQITNNLPFERFLNGSVEDAVADSGDAPPPVDSWDSLPSNPAALTSMLDDEEEEDPPQQKPTTNKDSRFAVQRVVMVDASPGGYCLEWRDSMPHLVKAGEMVALKEDGRNRWTIGVIRWVKQVTPTTTHVGIQILAPSSIPYGASVIQSSGPGTEFLRALMLPELKSINQPATLLVSAVSFHEYNMVKLNRNGETETIQITQKVFSTGAICQFEFRRLDQPGPSKAAPSADFNSVWDKS